MLRLFLLMLLPGCTKAGTEGPRVALRQPDSDDRVLFFFDAQCPDCDVVKEELLSRLMEKHEIARADVVYFDVAAPSTLDVLRQLEELLDFEASIMAPILIIRRKAYCGVAEVEEALASEGDLLPVGY